MNDPRSSSSMVVDVGAVPRWLVPATAAVSMFVPKPWDLALEREMAVAVILRICRFHGVDVTEAAAAACNQRILTAFTRGYRGNRLFNATVATCYLLGPPLLNGAMTATLLHVTRRVVERHLETHASLQDLTDERIRRALVDLMPSRFSDGADRR